MPVRLPESLRWLKEVQNLQRSLVSEGFERALDVVEAQVGEGFVRHRVPCGSEVYTWIVPPRWRMREATIKADGKLLVDAAGHPLHLVTHSVPFRGAIGRDELLQHLHTDPSHPSAIPYVYSFYSPRWGSCVPHDWLDRFTADRYGVVVDTELPSDADLVIGEATLRGETPRQIVLTAHIDHPGHVDDGMGGVAALVELIRHFRSGGGYKGHFTLTFLFTCETIGALCYLSRFEAEAQRFIEACIAREALGKDVPLAFAQSFRGDTQLDRAAQCVFAERFGSFERVPFLYLLANDDHIFDGPGFIPSLSIARAPYHEYHTSLDSVEAFVPERFAEALGVIRDVVELLNRNVVPYPRFKNVPFLTRYGIWFDWCSIPEYRNPLEKFFRLLDGRHSVVDLSVESGLSLGRVEQFLGVMKAGGLVEYGPAAIKGGRSS